jgi:hypothetical protein
MLEGKGVAIKQPQEPRLRRGEIVIGGRMSGGVSMTFRESAVRKMSGSSRLEAPGLRLALGQGLWGGESN